MGDASNILWKMTRSHMTDCTRRRISPRRSTNERLWVEALHPSRASPIEFFTYPTHSTDFVGWVEPLRNPSPSRPIRSPFTELAFRSGDVARPILRIDPTPHHAMERRK